MDRIFTIPRRTLHGSFRDYVRGVFAERSPRRRAVRRQRVLWLNGFAPRASSSGEQQRWEDEGGRTR